jgi:hypothetical protein
VQIKEIKAIGDKVAGIVIDLRQGVEFQPMIAVQRASPVEVVLIDGHHRATAYALTGLPTQIEVYIGTSVNMDRWHWV